MTLKDLAKELDLPYQSVIRVSTKESRSLKAISLIHAYTLMPLEELLPSSYRNIAKQMREFKESRPTRELASTKRKLYSEGKEYPRGSRFEITYEDPEIIRLELNGDILHLPHATFNEFFKRVSK